MCVRGEGCEVIDTRGVASPGRALGDVLHAARLRPRRGDRRGRRRAARGRSRTPPTGRPRRPRRSSWPPSSPRARRATSPTPSSPAAARSRSSRPGRSRGSTSSRRASRARHKVIARRDRLPRREPRGARRSRASTATRRRSARRALEVRHVANTNRYRQPDGDDDAAFCARLLAEIEAVIKEEGPETIAMISAEPIQNAGGCFTPPEGYWPGLREICDRHGILLHADEVISGFGRLGEILRRHPLRRRARRDHAREGPDLRPRPDGRGDALGADRGRAPRARLHPDARPHLRRAPGVRGGRAEVPRDLRARGRPRGRPRARSPFLERADARAARDPRRRRRARRRVLLGRGDRGRRGGLAARRAPRSCASSAR